MSRITGHELWNHIHACWGRPDEHFLSQELYWDFFTTPQDYVIESWLQKEAK